jgi:hypothetical protein
MTPDLSRRHHAVAPRCARIVSVCASGRDLSACAVRDGYRSNQVSVVLPNDTPRNSIVTEGTAGSLMSTTHRRWLTVALRFSHETMASDVRALHLLIAPRFGGACADFLPGSALANLLRHALTMCLPSRPRLYVGRGLQSPERGATNGTMGTGRVRPMRGVLGRALLRRRSALLPGVGKARAATSRMTTAGIEVHSATSVTLRTLTIATTIAASLRAIFRRLCPPRRT